MTVSATMPGAEQVDAVVEGEAASIAGADIDRYLALLTDDAVFLPPDSAPYEGDELRGWLREFLHDWRVEWLEWRHDETAIEGDLAYHRFSYSWRLTSKTSDEVFVSHGKGLHVLRRGPDGAWKIAREIWNGRPPPG